MFKHRGLLKLSWSGPWAQKSNYIITHNIWDLPAVAVTFFSGRNKRPLSDFTSTGVKYVPEQEIPEADVKHIKLNPILEIPKEQKKKFALLLSFSGQGYQGLQKNAVCRTIEGDLFAAMQAADLITDEEASVPQFFQYQRSSRTDKGVSAARLLVSAELPSVPDLQEQINKHLCDQIRVTAVYRVIKGFNSKSWCDSRTYSYMCPTFAFAPCTETASEDYRMTQDILEEVRKMLQMYKGLHNFHNFTSGVKYHDACAIRRIIDAECSNPFERDGLEWITIKITGQSFMLHQIRKMIALTIAISRGLASSDTIIRSFKEGFVDLPIAPAHGLVLEEQHFHNYNKKYASDGTREPLSWDKAAQNVKKIREQYIDRSIVNKEIKEKAMLKWLVIPHFHDYEAYVLAGISEMQEERRPSHGISPVWHAQKRIFQVNNAEMQHTDSKNNDQHDS